MTRLLLWAHWTHVSGSEWMQVEMNEQERNRDKVTERAKKREKSVNVQRRNRSNSLRHKSLLMRFLSSTNYTFYTPVREFTLSWSERIWWFLVTQWPNIHQVTPLIHNAESMVPGRFFLLEREREREKDQIVPCNWDLFCPSSSYSERSEYHVSPVEMGRQRIWGSPS